MLAKWLLGQTPTNPSYINFMEKVLGAASADWSNQKFNASKGQEIHKSIGAKAVLGAQDKHGEHKMKVEWKLHHYDCWDLSGKITDAKLETP